MTAVVRPVFGAFTQQLARRGALLGSKSFSEESASASVSGLALALDLASQWGLGLASASDLAVALASGLAMSMVSASALQSALVSEWELALPLGEESA